jgi:AcrR family transcriptional regulator
MSVGQRRATGDREGGVRDRLVDAAGSLIAERGSSAATSRAISERAGENLGSITYYFGSKDALVAEALIRQARGLLQPVLDELAGDRPPAEKLLAAVQALTAIVAERRDQLPGYLECLAQGPHHEGLATALQALSRDLRRQLAADMARQRDAGQIPGWVDPPAMASLIVALATGVVAEVVVDPDGTDPEAIGSQFAALLLAARDQATPRAGR